MILDDKKSQEEAREYVLVKPLCKPKTTIWEPILLLAFSIVLGIVTGKITLYFGSVIIHPILIYILSNLLVISFTAKYILILCVKCYQHYAPENLRRCCLCKPTCSEYAIIVLKKYCLIKAVSLIHKRLTKTCTELYKIDFPY